MSISCCCLYVFLTSCSFPAAYPDNTGGAAITQFEVMMTNPDNSSREVYRGSELTCVVAGLLPGRHYLFQVRASNKTGVSSWLVSRLAFEPCPLSSVKRYILDCRDGLTESVCIIFG